MNPRRIAPLVAVVVVAGLILYFTVIRHRGSSDDLAASGTVEATEAALGFQVPGRIQEVRPSEGDRVKAGDTLAWLDRTELEARRRQALAQVNAARAMLSELQSGSRPEELGQATAAARAAEGRLADAERDLQRVQRLFDGGAASQEQVDKAKVALNNATSQRDQAAEQLKMVTIGPRPERITGQEATVHQAEASLAQAEAALTNAMIRAPFDGVVSVRDREPGETVGAGAPVVTMLNLNDRWVRIYIREDRIGAVHLGQGATIKSDTYPDKQYKGSVSFISSEAEFTPRNVQTTEERVKLVYAVKVRITGDDRSELKPGMPADVSLQPTQTAESHP
jgi:HlyD family secretion protein